MTQLLRQAYFAISATLFGMLGLWAIIVFGSGAARFFAIWAAFAACLSQFVGQSTNRVAGIASIVLAYLAFALVVVALVFFSG